MGIISRIKNVISRVLSFPESDDKSDSEEAEIESEEEAIIEEFGGIEEVVDKIKKSKEKAERIEEAIDDTKEDAEDDAKGTEESGAAEDEYVETPDEIGEATEEAVESEDGAETEDIDTIKGFEEGTEESKEEAEEKADEEIGENEATVEELKEERDENSEDGGEEVDSVDERESEKEKAEKSAEPEFFEAVDTGKEKVEEIDEKDESEPEEIKEEEKPEPIREVQISEALDPKGDRIPIEEADEDKTYICPKSHSCSGLLIPRKGEKRAPHFAHKPDDPDLDRGETEKSQLPIFLGVSVHTFLQAFTEVPSLKWGDIDDPTTLEETLEKIHVDSNGVDGVVRPSTFHPEESNRVNLDSDADQFQIEIHSDGVSDALEGGQAADGLSPDDIFVGEETKARRIKSKPASVRNGQWVFSIIEKPVEDLSNPLELYKIGPWDALGAEVSDKTFPLLKEHLEIERTDMPGFDAHVLLPPEADPSTNAVFGESSEDFLVGIQTPPRLDPEMEVLLPGTDDHMVIAPTGEGRPSFYSSQFPEHGTQRVIFQALGQNKEIQINARDEEEELKPWRNEPELWIRVDTGQEKVHLNPTRGPTSVTLDPDIGSGSIDLRIVFEGPDRFRFDVVEARFPADADLSQVRRRGVTFDEVLAEIPHWVGEDCDKIRFHFGAAGTVEIGLGKPWEENLSKEEIRERLREMDELPQKARWSLVRKVFRASPGTRHIEFAGGTGGVKKRVRHALWEVQEERDND